MSLPLFYNVEEVLSLVKHYKRDSLPLLTQYFVWKFGLLSCDMIKVPTSINFNRYLKIQNCFTDWSMCLLDGYRTCIFNLFKFCVGFNIVGLLWLSVFIQSEKAVTHMKKCFYYFKLILLHLKLLK